MKSHVRLLDILDKAESGPIIEEKEFDKLLSKTVKELVKKYELKRDPAQAIVTDDALADRFFEAGMELALTVGTYCTSTHRQMRYTREEIETALRWAPAEIEIGSGLDKVTIRNRRPEDTNRPIMIGGPFGSPISEELYSKVMESYIQEPVIDSVVGGNFITIHGRRIKTGSPWEVLTAWREVELTKSAAQRAGRPGIPVGVVENAVTEIGELTATNKEGFDATYWHHTCFTSELKTNYALLIKVAHCIRTGSIIHDFANPIYGGHAGGAEGVGVVAVASIILLSVVNMSTTHSICPTHPFYNCDTAPEIIWSVSAAQQAIARNTHLLTAVMTSPVSGPGTESLLFECATMATTATVSGTSRIDGVRSAVGVVDEHVSGLEARFNAEAAYAATGMSRKDANEMILQFQKGYVDYLDKLPIGKSFSEVYDVRTLKPTQEWMDVYNSVKEKVRAIGLPMK